MIFVTIGTHEPFDRLVRAVDDWYGKSDKSQVIFGQVTEKGLKGYRPKHFDATDRLSPADYSVRFSKADLIVSHAGMGSIITALQMGKPIVVMPRRAHLGETRNDHQFTTAKMIGDHSSIYVAEDEKKFAGTMDRALVEIKTSERNQISEYAEPAFTDALRHFLLETTRSKI